MLKHIDLLNIVSKVFVELLTLALIFCGVAVITTVIIAIASAVGIKVVVFSILLIMYVFMDCL